MPALTERFREDMARARDCDDLFESQAKVELPVLNGAALPLSFFPQDIPPDQVLDPLSRLVAQSPDLRAQAAEMIWAEMQMLLEIRQEDYASLQDMLDTEGAGRGFDDLRAPTAPDDLWRLLRFRKVYLDKSSEPGVLNAILVADQAWDCEHGIGLFFRDGATLVAATDPSAFI